ncbi:MAG TPA: methyltransferase domain-containing protein, partial [Candidatus Angelobacter sp.]|nr:methyltransferase domain-containing protein [Candidatus Angelobacter sp.]
MDTDTGEFQEKRLAHCEEAEKFYRAAAACGQNTGMRVLDVGCGSGDVAFLAADLVGPTGEVIGADCAAAAAQRATARAQARDLRNVKFLEGDPTEMQFDRPFDAVIG